MNLPQLGTLEEVSLREAWAHEAHSFTPWLAEHLDMLAQEIGVPLEFEGREVAVENFSADILARNPLNDSLVLIENQLKITDHNHLGQIMTYLAGLDVQTVIWIAANFQEAHLSAVRWLNDHTVEPFAFFAVKVKVVRIGQSPLAPVFDVLVKPNRWERHLQVIAQETKAPSEIMQFRRDFWGHYAGRYPDILHDTVSGANSNRWRVIESLNVVISRYVAKGQVGLFIRSKDSDSAYEILLPFADQLRQTTGVDIGQQEGTYLFNAAYKADTGDRNRWDELIDWLEKKTQDYEQALRALGG